MRRDDLQQAQCSLVHKSRITCYCPKYETSAYWHADQISRGLERSSRLLAHGSTINAAQPWADKADRLNARVHCAEGRLYKTMAGPGLPNAGLQAQRWDLGRTSQTNGCPCWETLARSDWPTNGGTAGLQCTIWRTRSSRQTNH
jgi:hypothetical protein